MQPPATPPSPTLLRHPTPPPPAASSVSTMPPPPPPPSPSNHRTRPPPDLPLPSALVPPKKRRVFRTPPKATTPPPPPPPPPVIPVAVPVAVAFPTTPPHADHAESPLFPAQKPSPPPSPPVENPSSPPHPPPLPTGNPPSPPPPPPPAENPSSPPPPQFAEEPPSPPPAPPAEKPPSPPPAPPAEKPPSPPPPPPPPEENPPSPPPPPPPPSTADEQPYAPIPTDAAAEPAPAPKPGKITLKLRRIRRRVPKGTITGFTPQKAAAAEVGASQPQPGKKGHAPDDSSRNAAVDEVVRKEQSFGGNAIEKPATTCKPVPVCETQLGKGTAVRETQLGKGTVGGGTLSAGLAMDTDGEHEVEKKLGSRDEDRDEVGMSERQKRRMREVFVGGLNRDAKEEDVRAALSVAGEITEVRMIMDAATKKNKGYCFVRYRQAAQARKAIARFSNVKICGKQCRVAALGGDDKIFLGNIDKKWKKEDIMKLLQKIGVENIDVVTLLADSNNPGYNRGFAFLELETYRDAQIAYRKLSRKDVFGKDLNIRVGWAEPLNAPDEKQIQKVNRATLAKSVQKGMKNREDHKFYIGEKDKTKTVKSGRKLPSSSRVVPVIGDKSSDHGLVQVLRELAPWRHEHTGSGILTQNYARILSGEKRPFSALGGHERNTYATSTSSYSASPSVTTWYSFPYLHESRRCLLDPDSVLSEPLGGIQMRQACSRKSGTSHDSWH